jgi:hypothetical protein
MYIKNQIFTLSFLCVILYFSQEGIAVYSDYLSDNYYLIHPSMAGAANCAKIRLTARNNGLVKRMLRSFKQLVLMEGLAKSRVFF